MDNQSRLLEMYRSLRCLDHDKHDITIEYVESPSCND